MYLAGHWFALSVSETSPAISDSADMAMEL